MLKLGKRFGSLLQRANGFGFFLFFLRLSLCPRTPFMRDKISQVLYVMPPFFPTLLLLYLFLLLSQHSVLFQAYIFSRARNKFCLCISSFSPPWEKVFSRVRACLRGWAGRTCTTGLIKLRRRSPLDPQPVLSFRVISFRECRQCGSIVVHATARESETCQTEPPATPKHPCLHQLYHDLCHRHQFSQREE